VTYGKRQMLPSPIAEPAAARMNPSFELQAPRGDWSMKLLLDDEGCVKYR
jgi:hypothetical protein